MSNIQSIISESQPIINEATNTVFECSAASGIGYLFARIFTSINPINFAVVSGLSWLIGKATQPIFDRLFCGPRSNEASQTFGVILNISVAVASATCIGATVGFPVAFSALVLNALAIVALAVALVTTISLVISLKKVMQNQF